VNLGMGESIGSHNVEYQSQESVHVLASGNASTFTLVSFPGLNLLLPRCLTVSPEGFYGLMGLLFVIDKIKSHLFSIASKGRSFFMAQAVQLEHGTVAHLKIPFDSCICQLSPQRFGHIHPAWNADAAQVLCLKSNSDK
jgi:hypothetical protein